MSGCGIVRRVSHASCVTRVGWSRWRAQTRLPALWPPWLWAKSAAPVDAYTNGATPTAAACRCPQAHRHVVHAALVAAPQQAFDGAAASPTSSATPSGSVQMARSVWARCCLVCRFVSVHREDVARWLSARVVASRLDASRRLVDNRTTHTRTPILTSGVLAWCRVMRTVPLLLSAAAASCTLSSCSSRSIANKRLVHRLK